MDADKVALPFRRADYYRDIQFLCGTENCLQQNQVGNIEVADRHTVVLALRQHIA